MQSVTWIFMANVAVWLGLGAYVAYLALGQKALKKRLAMLERHDHV